jgi:Holliday junction resolvase RusA-like endonuclease
VKQLEIDADAENRAVAALKQGRIGNHSGDGEKSLKRPIFSVSFFVPGQPVGKGRPRAARRGRHIQLYTPEKTASYESLVATAAHGAMRGAAPIKGACHVEMDIRLLVPMSWSAKKRNQALEGLVFPTKKPDMDNVLKAVFDAINGIVWEDDVQAVYVQAVKRYSAIPGVSVNVKSVETGV